MDCKITSEQRTEDTIEALFSRLKKSIMVKHLSEITTRIYVMPSSSPSVVWRKISNNTTASATGYWHRWFRLWKSCVFNKQPDASQQANSNHIIRHATKHRPAKHADRLFSTGRDQPLPYFRGIFDFRQRYVRLLLYKCRFICPLCRLFPSPPEQDDGPDRRNRRWRGTIGNQPYHDQGLAGSHHRAVGTTFYRRKQQYSSDNNKELSTRETDVLQLTSKAAPTKNCRQAEHQPEHSPQPPQEHHDQARHQNSIGTYLLCHHERHYFRRRHRTLKSLHVVIDSHSSLPFLCNRKILIVYN